MKNLLRIFDKYTAVIACILIALLMFYSEHDRTKLKNESDLVSISGRLKNYSFLDDLPKNGQLYIINLVEYDNDFQIFADHIPLLRKVEFQQLVSIGNSITIQIPKEQRSKLNLKDERVMIVGLLVSEKEFLNSRQVILKEKDFSGLIAGFGFLIAGVLVFIVKFKDLV